VVAHLAQDLFLSLQDHRRIGGLAGQQRQLAAVEAGIVDDVGRTVDAEAVTR
jgi:hypothetical protein